MKSTTKNETLSPGHSRVTMSRPVESFARGATVQPLASSALSPLCACSIPIQNAYGEREPSQSVPPSTSSTQPSTQQSNLLRTKERITIGTWNVRTLNKKGSSELLLNELSKFTCDLVGLSEVRWIGTGVKQLGSYDIFYSGETTHVGGVALLVSHKVKHTMIGLNCVSSRIISHVSKDRK